MKFLHVPTSGEVCVLILLDAGSVQEKVGQRGMAHVVEHMVFKTSLCLKENDFGGIIAKHGAAFNAWTGFSSVGFYVTCQESNAAMFSKLLCSIVFGSVFRESELRRENLTVFDECNRRENNTSTVMWKLCREVCGMCEIKHDPIGCMEDLTNMTSKDLQDFYDATFLHERAVMVLASPSNLFTKVDFSPFLHPASARARATVPSARTIIANQNCDCVYGMKEVVTVTARMPDITEPEVMFVWPLVLSDGVFRSFDKRLFDSATQWVNIALSKHMKLQFMQAGFMDVTFAFEWQNPNIVGVMLNGRSSSMCVNWPKLYAAVVSMQSVLTADVFRDVAYMWRYNEKEKGLELKHNAQHIATMHAEAYLDHTVNGFLTTTAVNESEALKLALKLVAIICKRPTDKGGKVHRRVAVLPNPNPKKFKEVEKTFKTYVDTWTSKPVDFEPNSSALKILEEGGGGVCPTHAHLNTLPGFALPSQPFDLADRTVCVAVPSSGVHWFDTDVFMPNQVNMKIMHFICKFNNVLLAKDINMSATPQGWLYLIDLTNTYKDTPCDLLEKFKTLLLSSCHAADLKKKLCEWKRAYIPVLQNNEADASTIASKKTTELLWGKPYVENIVRYVETLNETTLWTSWQAYVRGLSDVAPTALIALASPTPPALLDTPCKKSAGIPNTLNPTQAVIRLTFNLGLVYDSELVVQNVLAWQNWMCGGFGSILYDLRETTGLFYAIRGECLPGIDVLPVRGTPALFKLETTTHPSKARLCVDKIVEAVVTSTKTFKGTHGLIGLRSHTQSVFRSTFEKVLFETSARITGFDSKKFTRVPECITHHPLPTLKTHVVVGGG